MKKQLILLCLVCTTILSLNNAFGPAAFAGQGYTGAPGESGTVCGNCHVGGIFGTPTPTLTVEDMGGDLVTEYIAGETYTISLTAEGTSGSATGYGFQLTILDDNDTDLATTFSGPSANAKISTAVNVDGGRTYAEHNGMSATNVFTVDWTAPAGGTGDATMYYNINLVDGTGNTANDNGGSGYSTSFAESVPEVRVIGALNINDEFLFPNVDGTADQILATDGAGTLSWVDPTPAFAGNSGSQSFRSSMLEVGETATNKKIELLETEVKLLKSEIEALRILIEKLIKDN